MLGKYGEQLALQYLKSKGYLLVEQNFRCRLGEFDLILRDKGVLVFVEVKTRQSTAYGAPFEAVGWIKQKRMVRLAQLYLKLRMRSLSVLSRFDIIAINVDEPGHEQIRHLINAFATAKYSN